MKFIKVSPKRTRYVAFRKSLKSVTKNYDFPEEVIREVY